MVTGARRCKASPESCNLLFRPRDFSIDDGESIPNCLPAPEQRGGILHVVIWGHADVPERSCARSSSGNCRQAKGSTMRQKHDP
jgi:hypothetical protein